MKDHVQDISTSQLHFGVEYENGFNVFILSRFEENKYKNILSKVNKPEFLEKIEYIKEIRTQRIS